VVAGTSAFQHQTLVWRLLRPLVEVDRERCLFVALSPCGESSCGAISFVVPALPRSPMSPTHSVGHKISYTSVRNTSESVTPANVITDSSPVQERAPRIVMFCP
jgi:hypothetical protein